MDPGSADLSVATRPSGFREALEREVGVAEKSETDKVSSAQIGELAYSYVYVYLNGGVRDHFWVRFVSVPAEARSLSTPVYALP